MSGRVLPRTPGIIILSQPPPKPRRKGEKQSGPRKIHIPAGDDNFSKDLLESLKEGGEKVSFATSCIAREFLNTDTSMLSEDVDSLNKLLEEIAVDNPDIIEEFLDSYFMEKNNKVNKCCWEAVIELFLALLKISLGEVKTVYTCVQALYTLSLLDENIQTMHHLEMTPILLGVISAYMSNHSVLEKSALLLARLTKYPQQYGLKIVVKDTAVDILVRVLDAYGHSTNVVVPVLRALANTLRTIKSNASVAQQNNDGEALASLQDSLLKQSAVLSYINEHGRSHVELLMRRFPTDLSVQVECHRFLHLTQSPVQQVRQMRRMSNELQMLQPRSILRRDSSPFAAKRVSFYTIPLDSNSEEESSDIEVDQQDVDR